MDTKAGKTILVYPSVCVLHSQLSVFSEVMMGLEKLLFSSHQQNRAYVVSVLLLGTRPGNAPSKSCATA